MLIQLLLVCLVVGSLNCDDFCNAQKNCYVNCKECEKYAMQPNIITNYVLHEMTDDIRAVILDQMNMFRNNVALGKTYSLLLPPAANMGQMLWDDELEYYMTLKFVNDRTCESYGPSRTGWHAYYYDRNGGFTAKLFIENAMAVIFGMTINTTKNKVDWTMSMNFRANNTRIGCAYGTSVDTLGNTSMNMVCATAAKSAAGLSDAYEIGDVCSKCSASGENVCSSRYKGLCDYLIDYQISTHESISEFKISSA